MYGTVARIHPKADRDAELQALLAEFGTDGQAPTGFRHSFIFRPDQNPYDRPTLFLIALFDDQDTYRANAASPEQDAEYRRMRELLEDDPDWMDGTFEGT